ncbi:MAG: autotransporter-associated beta strand repeat-containing protein [Candidatus Omnitrophota bacterium]
MKKFLSIVAILSLVFSPITPALAVDSVWDGSASALWSLAGNWTPETVPVSGGNPAVFRNAGGGWTTIDLGVGGAAVSNIIFDNTGGGLPSFSIGSGGAGTQTLTLDASGAITINANAGVGDDQYIQASVTLSGAGSFINNANAATFADLYVNGDVTDGAGSYLLTVSGDGNTGITGDVSVGGGITKTGTGTLTLSGTNTYTGTTTINAGTLTLSGGSAIVDTGAVSLADVDGAILKLNASETIGSLSGGGTTGGNVDLWDYTLTVGDASDTVYGGIISNNAAGGHLTKQGSGTLTLSGANTYTGTTTVNDGTLRITTATGLGTVDGGVSVADGATLDLAGDFDVGAETVTLATGSTLSSSSGTNSIAGTVGITGTSTVDVDGTSLGLSGVISGGDLTKTGAGTLVLSGANTYTGDTTVNAGVLNLQNDYAAGTSDQVTVADGAALQIQGGITVKANALVINGTGVGGTGAVRNISGDNSWTNIVVALDSDARINSDAGMLTLLGSGDMMIGVSNLTVGGAGNTTINGDISIGAKTLTKDGAGTLTLTGMSGYSGATTVNEGVLNIQNAGALGTSGTSVTSGAALEIQGGITVDEDLTLNGTGISSGGALRNISGDNIYSGAITLGSDVRINSDSGSNLELNGGITGAYDLTVGGSGTTNVSSVIGTGAGTLTKDGSGTLTFSGAEANTYSGVMTVSAGELDLNKTTGITAIAGDLTINGTGTAKLLASNQIANDATITVETGGTFSLNSMNETVTAFTNSGGTFTTGAGHLTVGGIKTLTWSGGTNTINDGGTVEDNHIVIEGGTNTVQGGTTGGVLQLNAGGTGLEMTGATLTLNSDAAVGGKLLLKGDVATNASATTSNISNGLALANSGTVDLDNETRTFTVADGAAANDLTISAVIDNGALTKAGAGTLTLSGDAANTYAGVTTVSAGELDLNKTEGIDAIAGNLTIGGGTVKWLKDEQVCDSVTITMTSGALSLNGMDETVTAFSNSGGTFTTGTGHLIGTGATVTWSGGTNTINDGGTVEDGHIVITGGTNTVEGGATGGVLQLNAGGTGLEMTGATLTLNSDGTTAGKLLLQGDVTTYASATTSNISNGLALANSGTVDLDGGTRTFTIADGAAANDLAISAVIDNGALTKAGAGTLTLSGANTYTGRTTINAGTLDLTGGDAIVDTGAVSLANVAGAKLVLNDDETIGSLSGGGALGGNIELGNSTLTFGDASNTTYSGIISNFKGGCLIKQGTGTLTLTGAHHTYKGLTTINEGTLKFSGNTTLDGGLTNAAAGVLDIGLNTLTLAGNYKQDAGTPTLNVTLSGAANGTIDATATGNAADFNAGTIHAARGSGRITNGQKYTIYDAAVGAMDFSGITVTSGIRNVNFTISTTGDDLILTAVGSSGYIFGTVSTGGNAEAVGNTLDKIVEAGATGDMANVIDKLDGMGSDAEVAGAMATMEPDVSTGTVEGSRVLTGQSFVTISNRLGGARSGFVGSGVSSGDMTDGMGVWIQGLGSNMKQDERKGIQGFSANTWGTTIGADKVIDKHFRLGLAGSYGWAGVHSKQPGSPSNDINSFQGTIYGSYDSLDLNKARQGGKKSYEAVRSQVENSWYVDGMFAFTQDNYDSRREIWLTSADKRVAKAEHYGQQYSTKFETGYTFVFEKTKKLEITPFASLGYNFLYMNKYKENGANALNLSVQGEGFHQLEQGLGTKLAYPIVAKKVGTFIPSAKAAWLYDYMGDRFETTASFAGGGPSFNTQGAKPAKNGMLFGAELAFLNKGNMTLTGNWDIELKDQFISNTYYGTVRYDF